MNSYKFDDISVGLEEHFSVKVDADKLDKFLVTLNAPPYGEWMSSPKRIILLSFSNKDFKCSFKD